MAEAWLLSYKTMLFYFLYTHIFALFQYFHYEL